MVTLAFCVIKLSYLGNYPGINVGIPLISTNLDIALRVVDIDIASVNSKGQLESADK
jgi:hypothetical protein